MEEENKMMYKRGSWIQSGTWKPQGYIPFLPSPLWPCVCSPSGQWGFSSPHTGITGMNVLQVVKWPTCQQIGDLTVPAIMEGCSASRLCPPTSTPTLELKHPRSVNCKDEPASQTFTARVKIWAVASRIWLRSVGNLTVREKICSIKGCFPGAAISDASSTFFG